MVRYTEYLDEDGPNTFSPVPGMEDCPLSDLRSALPFFGMEYYMAGRSTSGSGSNKSMITVTVIRTRDCIVLLGKIIFQWQFLWGGYMPAQISFVGAEWVPPYYECSTRLFALLGITYKERTKSEDVIVNTCW